MPKIKVKSVDQISRIPVSYAFAAFMRHCQLKNLAPYSHLYYNKNIQYFLDTENEIKYVDEICPEVIERFIGKLMDRGNKVTAINARLRAVFVFLRYCFDQEYLDAFPISLIKEDETLKEPYTEAELQKLLKQPETSFWAESLKYLFGGIYSYSDIPRLAIFVNSPISFSDILCQASASSSSRLFMVIQPMIYSLLFRSFWILGTRL